ncbi:hypothetical protein RDWZM_002361 [Blomia tropicalis]|uniref:Uncharacterized protein n=1 Tax=Blomia tropicalis TaxID=40697 RepID=A0A9Q0MDC4_BLOTA|nr:hypothetical protein RDWZM_002361 [Blomia tropicalis]
MSSNNQQANNLNKLNNLTLTDFDAYETTMPQNMIGDGSLLPVAAIYQNLDLYIDSINTRYIGNILEDIGQLDDGSFIVISSIIDSKYNCGFVTRFHHIENIPNAPSLYLNPRMGPCNVMEIPRRKHIVCGFDSGDLILARGHDLLVEKSCQFFHNIVTSMSMIDDHSLILAGDYDGRIVLVDVESFDPLKMFNYTHDGSVNDLQWSPSGSDNQQFLSCGSDNHILLWDLRAKGNIKPAAAQLICTSQPTALFWGKENEIMFGTEIGNVVRFDLRNRQVLKTERLFPDHRIHRIKSLDTFKSGDKKKPTSVGIVADDCNQLMIYDLNLNICKKQEQYPEQIAIRSMIQFADGHEKTNELRLATIGSKQSVFVHNHHC